MYNCVCYNVHPFQVRFYSLLDHKNVRLYSFATKAIQFAYSQKITHLFHWFSIRPSFMLVREGKMNTKMPLHINVLDNNFIHEYVLHIRVHDIGTNGVHGNHWTVLWTQTQFSINWTLCFWKTTFAWGAYVDEANARVWLFAWLEICVKSIFLSHFCILEFEIVFSWFVDAFFFYFNICWIDLWSTYFIVSFAT